jgi:pimeloyl-ACP methyl ester carboxylesterase
VVIDAGLGESSASWQDVVRLLGGTSICTFDRAGYGDSDPGPEPRTPQRNAGDLARLLDAAELEQPIILIGHSIGGLNALAFWRAFPERVEGLMLLDPPPRAWLEGRRFFGLWGMAVAVGEGLQAQSAVADPGSPKRRMLTAMASEHLGMLQEGAAVSEIESFGDLPLLVVAAGRANPAFGDSASAYQAFWVSESESLAARSSHGSFARLDQVGHNMNAEVPQTIADLVRDFVSSIRDPS